MNGRFALRPSVDSLYYPRVETGAGHAPARRPGAGVMACAGRGADGPPRGWGDGLRGAWGRWPAQGLGRWPARGVGPTARSGAAGSDDSVLGADATHVEPAA